ncbi:MAP kinase [Aureococcus anophagefferens]|nr:MAP kinase [Aureococcus anophagefferens]
MAAAITRGGSRAQLFQTLEEKKPERPAWLEDTDSDSDGEAPPEAALDPRSVPEYPLVEKALLRQYEICSQCGGTGRCVVYKAFERERRRFVALKVVVDAFGDRQSAQRAYREVAYLQVLCGHPNIGRLRGVYCSDVGRHVVLTLDYMHSDLRHAIVSGRLLPIHRTYVLRQLFLALAFMHSARIVHRDIRPSNIVVDDRCRAQVVDFHSAKFVGEAWAYSATGDLDARRAPGLTDDTGCVFYRPCDHVMGSKQAGGPEGDVWAAGCVAVEMETTVPTFAGSSALDVLSLQLAVLGAPSFPELAAMGCAPPHPAEAVVAAAVALDARRRNVGLRDHMPRSTDAPNFIECCQIVPGRRITAHDALRHPLFDRFRGTDVERNFDGAAQFADLELHCGEALDEGGARLPPSEYRVKLTTYVKIFSARKLRGDDKSWGSTVESSVKSSSGGTYNSDRGRGGDHDGNKADAPAPELSDSDSDGYI